MQNNVSISTLDETMIREFTTKGETLQAVKLVMKQTGMNIVDALKYVDDYCLHENIMMTPLTISYSSSKVDGAMVYYMIANGEKHIIPKKEAPEALVNGTFTFDKQPRDSQLKERQLKTRKANAFNNLLNYLFGFLCFFQLALFITMEFSFGDGYRGLIVRLCCFVITVLLLPAMVVFYHIYIINNKKKIVSDILIAVAVLIIPFFLFNIIGTCQDLHTPPVTSKCEFRLYREHRVSSYKVVLANSQKISFFKSSFEKAPLGVKYNATYSGEITYYPNSKTRVQITDIKLIKDYPSLIESIIN